MRLDNEKPSDNVEDRRSDGGMGGGFGLPGGRGGGLNIPMGGRGGGFSIRTIIILVIIYFALKMLFGIDLLKSIQGGLENQGGTGTQVTTPGTGTSTDSGGGTPGTA